MTTFDPGASVVFTHGFAFRPFSLAFFASRPAASITDGFDVFVQEVIAAMATAPWSSTNSPFAPFTVTGFDADVGAWLMSVSAWNWCW